MNLRIVNILTRAVEEGFSVNLQSTVQNTMIDATNHLIGKVEAEEVYCKVDTTGKSQYVSYTDSSGFQYVIDGEILGEAFEREPDKRYIYHRIVDQQAKVIALYDIKNVVE